MIDGGKILGGTFEDINEAVVKPVADEVGRALEQGAQAVKGGQTQPQSGNVNPQKIQQTQLDEQQKIRQWRWRLDQIKKLNDEQKRSASAKTSADKEEKKVKQFEIVKKQQKNVALERAKVKTEIRGGVGG